MAPSAAGAFTAKVTSPMLTMTRVGCILETTAITRRDVRGYTELIEPRPWRPVPTDADAPTRALDARERRARFSVADLQEVAHAIASHVDPDSSQLPERVYKDLVSLNTALFAIEYASQHLNLTEACDEFRRAVEPGQFPDTSIDRNQAGNIFCWGAKFGLYFGISSMDVADKIATAIYILQAGQSFAADLRCVWECQWHSWYKIRDHNVDGVCFDNRDWHDQHCWLYCYSSATWVGLLDNGQRRVSPVDQFITPWSHCIWQDGDRQQHGMDNRIWPNGWSSKYNWFPGQRR
ncbi:hypothetical protein DV737_g1133, partial [Chaetothyriales sp. CBS 132003]